MLVLQGLTRGVGERTLFEDIHWTVHRGERIGLVGPNGCGKSTLLRIIAGHDEPERGRVLLRGGARVAYLPQEVEAEVRRDTSVLEAALEGADELRALGTALDELAETMARLAEQEDQAKELERVSEEYGQRRAVFEWAGGDQLESRAQSVLSGLGFAVEEFSRPVSELSGGWRMRVLMARMLLSGADILLLDEPTNHLDLDALAWLEEHLANSPAAVIVVSHDRVFLDRIANRIADLVGTRLRVTTGAYSAWVAARALEREQTEARAVRLAEEEARLQRFVERFGAKQTKASQANDRKKVLAKVREERAKLAYDPSVSWSLRWPEAPPCSDPLIQLEGLSCGYDSRTVLADLGLEIRRGERLAVLGPNGAGKTTLLRVLCGELLPTRGRKRSAQGLVIGRFAQHQLDTMDAKRSVLEQLDNDAPGHTPERLRAALGALGLGASHVERAVETLSGGERARLALARLMLSPASLLLLDEPTNHLDLPLREALEAALAAWKGTLIVVSHDRAFLSRLTTATLVVDEQGVRRLDGGWQAWLAERSAARAPEVTAEGPSHAKSRAGRRARAEALRERSQRLRPLRERVATLERAIAEAEERRDAIDVELARPDAYGDGARLKALNGERGELVRRLGTIEVEWAEAAEELEALEAEE